MFNTKINLIIIDLNTRYYEDRYKYLKTFVAGGVIVMMMMMMMMMKLNVDDDDQICKREPGELFFHFFFKVKALFLFTDLHPYFII